MTQTQLTKVQQAKLAEALEVAKQFEQQAKELSDLGYAFADKWENCLRKDKQAIVHKQDE